MPMMEGEMPTTYGLIWYLHFRILEVPLNMLWIEKGGETYWALGNPLQRDPICSFTVVGIPLCLLNIALENGSVQNT